MHQAHAGFVLPWNQPEGALGIHRALILKFHVVGFIEPVFQVGDQVKVLVKDINDTKIALSLKFPETNPWAHAAEDFAVGSEVTGKVARMTDFGAFVELAPGVDALLHVSQISRAHVEKPSDVLSIGQEITAKVVDLNEAEKKISLSMKALEPDTVEETEE